MNTTWRHRPFTLESAPSEILDVPTMMKPQELDILYSLAKNHFTGRGCIIDAGLFMGASTRCFYEGLRRNPNVSQFSIRSYELAVKNRFMPNIPQLQPINEGDSYRHVLEDAFASFEGVDLHIGDICNEQHDGSPIEIMFLDVLKLPRILHHVNGSFMPSLVVGGILVQQDFFWPFAWWINGWMNYFSDYFDLVESAETTAVFQLVKPLPENAFDRKFMATVGEEQILQLLKAPPFTTNRIDHILGQKLKVIHYLVQQKNYQRAREEMAEFEQRYGIILSDDMDPERRRRLQGDVLRLKAMTRRDLAG